MSMMCPPHSVKMVSTPSFFRALATRCPPEIRSSVASSLVVWSPLSAMVALLTPEPDTRCALGWCGKVESTQSVQDRILPTVQTTDSTTALAPDNSASHRSSGYLCAPEARDAGYRGIIGRAAGSPHVLRPA